MRRDRSAGRFLLLLLAVIVLGIYVLPSAVAKFAGSHTWEFNATTRVRQLQCQKCHWYIESEITTANTSGLAESAVKAHQNAAGSTNYINDSGAPLNFTVPGNDTVNKICLLCHQVEEAFTASTHTKVTIRACTDVDCHGENATDVNDTIQTATCAQVWGEEPCNVTGRINSDADAHYNFYRPLEQNYPSPYGREEGGNYRYGFISCLACHTHVGFNKNMTRPSKFESWWNFTGSISSGTGNMNMTDLEINDTLRNYSYGGKEPGSAWY